MTLYLLATVGFGIVASIRLPLRAGDRRLRPCPLFIMDGGGAARRSVTVLIKCHYKIV